MHYGSCSIRRSQNKQRLYGEMSGDMEKQTNCDEISSVFSTEPYPIVFLKTLARVLGAFKVKKRLWKEKMAA